ncbi:hypothetical protein SNEBB_002987 [Seison nebaliae]|nr:hypothetical protein SNEBB_002987 [Seison nebaliae]
MGEKYDKNRLMMRDLQDYDRKKLGSALREQQQKLSMCRTQNLSSNATSKRSQIRITRKNIARILITLHQKMKLGSAIFHVEKFGRKHLPKDLRPKKTRAIRRRLTKSEKSASRRREKMRKTFYPQRKYIVSA